MRRRTFLSVTACTAVAGCSSDTQSADDGGGGETATDTATEEQGTTDGPAAALRELDTQPMRGPAPEDASGLIVAFEDPSCPRCRVFEQNIVPKIRSNLVDSGRATYVFRGYPVIYPWGEPGTHALEATYGQDSDAFWSLTDHYFENQDEFRGKSAEEVYAKTESFLASETELDAAAVIETAQGESADTAVQTDLSAGRDAGAGRTTPHVFLFRDGEYQTKAAGSVSYETIEAVLQV